MDPGPVGATIRAELRQPVTAAVSAAAEEIRRRHGSALVACLFYGSCLRDGQDEGRVIDFYAIAGTYRRFHGSRLSAILNTLLPPNVYYLETRSNGRVVRAKYAVVSWRQLMRDTTAAAFQSSLWGRLAQPCALVYARDAEVERQITAALARAVETLAGQTLALMPGEFTAEQLWTRAFRESYGTELRSERSNRPRDLYLAYSDRYDSLTVAALPVSGIPAVGGEPSSPARLRHQLGAGARRAARLRWWLRRWVGKSLHVLRLVKAAYTFKDGLDYILWKIEKHSGVREEPTPWQRRHPLMAAPVLAWRLVRRGAFR
jgi:hypothetical protein